MNILGIVSKVHDSGIALLKDGVPHFVMEEERFNREKHTMDFPGQALDAAFDGSFGVSFSDVDVITLPWDMKRLRRTLFGNITARLPQSLNLLRPIAHKTHSNAIVNIPMRLWLGLGKKYGYTNLPKIIRPALVCRVLVTTRSTLWSRCDRPFSTTTMVPSSR